MGCETSLSRQIQSKHSVNRSKLSMGKRLDGLIAINLISFPSVTLNLNGLTGFSAVKCVNFACCIGQKKLAITVFELLLGSKYTIFLAHSVNDFGKRNAAIFDTKLIGVSTQLLLLSPHFCCAKKFGVLYKKSQHSMLHSGKTANFLLAKSGVKSPQIVANLTGVSTRLSLLSRESYGTKFFAVLFSDCLRCMSHLIALALS